MSWLAGSLAFAAATLTLLLSLVSTTPVMRDRPLTVADASGRLRARRTADDSDNIAEGAESRFLESVEQKRRWGNKNLAMWGKRGEFDDDDQVDKRRWGQKNMALWGKRAPYDLYNDVDADQWQQPAAKRRWGQKHMAMWGKRSDVDMLQYDADELEAAAAQKRKWGQKNMNLWG